MHCITQLWGSTTALDKDTQRRPTHDDDAIQTHTNCGHQWIIITIAIDFFFNWLDLLWGVYPYRCINNNNNTPPPPPLYNTIQQSITVAFSCPSSGGRPRTHKGMKKQQITGLSLIHFLRNGIGEVFSFNTAAGVSHLFVVCRALWYLYCELYWGWAWVWWHFLGCFYHEQYFHFWRTRHELFRRTTHSHTHGDEEQQTRMVALFLLRIVFLLHWEL